ncbi:MAG: hypothetical protein HYX69_10370 [Planctomycetia bacterium]|nr:hypothetical protein [Planctomycetia bacterium]
MKSWRSLSSGSGRGSAHPHAGVGMAPDALLPLALMCALTFASGCGRSADQRGAAPGESAHAAAPSTAAVDAQGGANSPGPDSATDSASSETSGINPEARDTASKPEEEEAAPPEPAPRERFVVFTPRGPLVCEATLSIDGRPHTRALERLVDKAMQAAQPDGEGTAAWRKVVASPRFRYGQFGNVTIKTDEDRRRAVLRYDRNRDDRVDRDEMRRFLARDSGGGGALVIHADDPYRDANIANAATWQLLDENHDQRLSAEELAAAADRLRSRDALDDDVIVAGELDVISTAPPEQERRRTLHVAVAHALARDTAWNALESIVKELYPGDVRQPADGRPWLTNLLAGLDANDNGSLSAKELMALADCEANVTLQASLGRDASGSPGSPALSVPSEGLRGIGPPAALRTGNDLVCLDVPGLIVEFSVADRAATMEDATAMAANQFKQFDKDANGYLDRDEFRLTGQAGGVLDGLDTDGDGKLYPNELADFLENERAAALALIHVDVGRLADALFAALDANGDGRLGSREIAGAAARLESFDADGDGQVSPEEIPDCMTVQLVRERRSADQPNMPRAARQTRTLPRSGPIWFQRMDTNGDGDVGPGEFLGTTEQFRKLDADGDGFIAADEAERAAGAAH